MKVQDGSWMMKGVTNPSSVKQRVEPPAWIYEREAHGQTVGVTTTFRASWLGFHYCLPKLASVHLWSSATQVQGMELEKHRFCLSKSTLHSQHAFPRPVCAHVCTLLFICSISLSSSVPQTFQMTLHPIPGRKCSGWLVPILSFPLNEEGVFLQALCVPKVTLLLLF